MGNVTAGVGVNANANANANVNANGVDVVRHKPAIHVREWTGRQARTAFSFVIDYQRFNTIPISEPIEAACLVAARRISRRYLSRCREKETLVKRA